MPERTPDGLKQRPPTDHQDFTKYLLLVIFGLVQKFFRKIPNLFIFSIQKKFFYKKLLFGKVNIQKLTFRYVATEDLQYQQPTQLKMILLEEVDGFLILSF
jgi:hypothetical protein